MRQFLFVVGVGMALCFHCASSFATAVNDDSEEKPLLALDNGAIENTCFSLEVEAMRGLHFARQHKVKWTEIARANASLLPTAGPDGEFPRKNGVGACWGYPPVISASVGDRLEEKRHAVHILDGRATYGLDGLALVRNFHHVFVTAMDTDQAHVDVMTRLAQMDQERPRFHPRQGDLLQEQPDLAEHFDLVILSRVLFVFDDGDAVKILQNVYKMLKPGGLVIMFNTSDHMTWLTRIYATFSHGFLPVKVAGSGFSWTRMMNPGIVQKLANRAGLNVLANQYCGMPRMHVLTQYWWAGLNLQEACTYSVLVRPEA